MELEFPAYRWEVHCHVPLKSAASKDSKSNLVQMLTLALVELQPPPQRVSKAPQAQVEMPEPVSKVPAQASLLLQTNHEASLPQLRATNHLVQLEVALQQARIQSHP